MKRLEYYVKMLPHPKYYKRLVGGCGKKKKGERKRKKKKRRICDFIRKKKSDIMIK